MNQFINHRLSVLKDSKKIMTLPIFFLLLVIAGFSQPDDKIACKAAAPMNIAIFLYDKVELLDFAGPLEVFSLAAKDSKKLFNVYTVGLDTGLIKSQKVLRIKPQYTLSNCPAPDIIVLPGGDTRQLRENEALINWLKESMKTTDIALSVCSGVTFLGEAGLLENQTATTHKYLIEKVKKNYPNTTFLANKRFIDSGQIITTAGISAGIDGALYVVQKLFGEDVSDAIVDWMEYDHWTSYKVDNNKK